MAVITFYDATVIDEYQLTDGLRGTDHYWQYISDSISLDNLNPEAEVISVFVSSAVTRQMMERLPRLKLIALRSTGFDNIDLDYARSRNITIVNVPTYGENTVAEHAFALLLAVVRNLVPSVDATERGEFQASRFVGMDLRGKTFGIIGLGSIGKCAAMIARGFDMKVLAYDVRPDEAFAQEHGVELQPLRTVLGESDIVSLHTPMTPTNYHLINEHTIDNMKRGAILINTARGELVESRALIRALQAGKLRGAGLDTLEGEQYLDRAAVIGAVGNNSTAPSSYEHATENFILLRMPNVVITKHVAFNTAEAIKRINDTTVKNIIDFWYGVSPNTVKQRASSGKLVIVRHAQSEWNALGKWTGTTDVHITPKGINDAAALGQSLTDIKFDYAYISQQVRTKETFEAFINGSGQLGLPYEASAAINERDYGVYTGMDKHSIQKVIGTEAFNELRRSWDGPVENGESLENVYQRTVPFYLRIVLPRLRHGQNILIVAHGNSIRSLIKYIENISDQAIGDLEMIQDSALCYEVDTEGRARTKEVRAATKEPEKPVEP
jgi:D-lactate dehydrogenase